VTGVSVIVGTDARDEGQAQALRIVAPRISYTVRNRIGERLRLGLHNTVDTANVMGESVLKELIPDDRRCYKTDQLFKTQEQQVSFGVLT
jgi:hypothetical protein